MGYVYLTVANLERQIEFYRQYIGLKLHWRKDATAGLGAGGEDLLRMTESRGARRFRATTGLYHFALLMPENILLVHVDADFWKTVVYRRFTFDPAAPGAILLFAAGNRDHYRFSMHLTAERQIEEFVAGKGVLKLWVRDRKDNHWGDTLYIATACGHFCGVGLLGATPRPAAAAATRPRIKPGPAIYGPGGQPFGTNER